MGIIVRNGFLIDFVIPGPGFLILFTISARFSHVCIAVLMESICRVDDIPSIWMANLTVRRK